ncbi:unnamed protein product, partial [Coregonus sp. 'balchen']
REAVRETLREKLDLEKRALQVEEDFLVDRRAAHQSMEEAAALLSQVTMQDSNPVTATSSVLTALSTTQCSVQNQDPAPPGSSITQVGMSRRGAQGLLKGHEARPKPGLVRLNLLEGLRSTFNEWCTEVSMKFLYGPDHFSKMTIETKKTEEEEEELDEDGGYCRRGWGWRGRRGSRGSTGRSSAPAPDYDTIRRETGAGAECQGVLQRGGSPAGVRETCRRLREVSPVVREALERPTSVEYLSILMQELPLQDQDLQSLVQLLKTIAL